MTKENLNIINLIIKERIDSLSEDERTTLEDWKTTSDNLNTYNEIINQQNVDQRFELYDHIDQQQPWKRIHKRIQPISIKLISQKISRWAAILILPLICAYFIYNYYSHKTKFQDFIDQNAEYDSKAVLILEDGKTIDLEKLESGELRISDNIKAINSNNKLTYKASNAKPNSLEEREIFNIAKTSKSINGEYSFVLSDGTKVWLNNETEFKYPIQFIGKQRKVYLKGEAQFEVSKNADKPFIVITDKMNIEVLGTHFNVKTYANGNITQTTLVEGSVKITTKDNEAILSPGYQAHLEDGLDLEIRKVNTNLFTSWVQGLYTFNNEKLVDITDMLQRWYKVDVFFENERTKEKRFTGAMNKNHPIDELIKLIEKTSSVKFSIMENALIISE